MVTRQGFISTRFTAVKEVSEKIASEIEIRKHRIQIKLDE